MWALTARRRSSGYPLAGRRLPPVLATGPPSGRGPTVYVDVGDLVALAAALGWAGTTVMARYISRSIPALWYNALRVGIGALAMLAISPWTLPRADLANVSTMAIALLLISVLTGFAIGDTAFFESMRQIGVARAAPIAGCHPLVTALLAVLFLGEPVTLALVFG